MNIQQAKEMMVIADACGHVPLITGLHGIGKSAISAEYARDNSMHYEPLILSLMDTGDLLGMPITQNVGGLMSTLWAAPSWYTNIVNAAWPNKLKVDRLQFNDTDFFEAVMSKHDGNTIIQREVLNTAYCDYYNVSEDRLQLLRQDNVAYLDSVRSVLLLDELNRALPDILNASLQLILDHRLHAHELPIIRGQETLIIAAVNPSDGSYTVQEFDPALLDRFVDCPVEADFKAFLTHSKATKLNKVVLDYLIDNQKKLHHVPEDGTKGASPRSWTRLGAYIDRIESKPDNVEPGYITGTIGSSLSAQFTLFFNSYSKGITTEKIEKMIKTEITKTKKAGEDINPETLAPCIVEIVEDLEAVRRSEFAESFITKFIKSKTAMQAMPMLTFLYALPLENLGAVLKNLQSDNITDYGHLAKLDKEANGKRLFLKLVSKI
jgi:hypothetical protein